MSARVTYRRRPAKRQFTPELLGIDSSDEEPRQSPVSTPRKRPRMDVEVVVPLSPNPKSRLAVSQPRNISGTSTFHDGGDYTEENGLPSRITPTKRGKESYPSDTEPPRTPQHSPKRRSKVEVLITSPRKSSPNKVANTGATKRKALDGEPPAREGSPALSSSKKHRPVSSYNDTQTSTSHSQPLHEDAHALAQSRPRPRPKPVSKEPKAHASKPPDSSRAMEPPPITPSRDTSVEFSKPVHKSTSKSSKHERTATHGPTRGPSPRGGQSDSGKGVPMRMKILDLDDDDILPVVGSSSRRTPNGNSQSRPSSTKQTPRPRPAKPTSRSKTPEASTRERTPSRAPPASYLFSPLTPLPPSLGPSPTKTNVDREDTLPVLPTISRTSSSKSVPKDLSDLFNFSPSKPTNESTPTGTDSSNAKPKVPLTKRMLARSRTESNLDGSLDSVISISSEDSHTKPALRRSASLQGNDTVIDLTGSFSTSSHSHSSGLVGVSASRVDLVDAGHSQHSEGQSQDQSQTNHTRPGLMPLVQPQAQIRTYAGASRSFLVELPVGGTSNMGMAIGGTAMGGPSVLDEDDLGLETRESYTALRERWGVDNSSDNPLHFSDSEHSESEPEESQESQKSRGKKRLKEKEKEAKVKAREAALPPGMMNDVKSITEMRSKGESRRFMDEVGYLFEGMNGEEAIGVRRGSALEIVSKLCDPDFSRRAKATDFLSRAWDVLREAGAADGDVVLDTILVVFAALAAQTPRELQDLAQKNDFVDVLCRMLEAVGRGKDPIELVLSGKTDIELKKVGVGRMEQSYLSRLRDIIEKSVFTSSNKYPSLRLLVSGALASLPPSCLQLSHFRPIHDTLLSELALLPSRLTAYEAGLPIIPESYTSASFIGSPSLEHIEHCLRIVDGYLLGLGTWNDDGTGEKEEILCARVTDGHEQEGLASGLATLNIVTTILLNDLSRDEHYAIANECLETTLRVLINLTHDNAAWCGLLLSHEPTLLAIVSLITRPQQRVPFSAFLPGDSKEDVKKSSAEIDTEFEQTEDKNVQAFDRLCLALGLLTNLVQTNREAKGLCRMIKVDPSCRNTRTCARSCHCPNRITVLECLVRVYLQYYQPDTMTTSSEEDFDAGTHIVRGHLAVLFGLLIRDSPENERIMLSALPGSVRRAKLDGLARHAKEFVGLYREFMSRVARGGGDGNGDDHGSDEGDEGVVGGGTTGVVRDGAGEGVARDVVLYLEGLRDGLE